MLLADGQSQSSLADGCGYFCFVSECNAQLAAVIARWLLFVVYLLFGSCLLFVVVCCLVDDC